MNQEGVSKAREALKSGDFDYAKTVALVEIAESLLRIANTMDVPMYHNIVPTHWVPVTGRDQSGE
jgi:hypothetical protein